MDDSATFSRRRYLALMAASGLGGLAGCSEQTGPSQPTTTTVSTASQTDPRQTEPPAETPTDGVEETKTPDQWSVNPVEHDKLVGAYYYQWYHGDDGYGLHDDRPWLEHVPGEPVLGQYHSRDKDVINQHLKWALEHGINWFMAHGAHPGSYDELTLRNHVLEADLADHMQFSLITGIPNKFREDGQYDMDDTELRRSVGEQLAEYEEIYFNRDNYLNIGGAPVIMFFAISKLAGDVAGAWKEIRGALDGDVYLIAHPHMGQSPGMTEMVSPAWELAKAFDAFTEYNMNPKLQNAYGEFREDDFERHYRDWRVATDEYGVDFIPMTVPGEDHSDIDWKEPRDFYLERKPDRFRRLCRDTLRYRNPNIDAVLVTSFNEWPEFTSVEPADSYGTTYLKIVEKELALGDQEPLPTDNYLTLSLQFNKVVDEQELNPSAQASRLLAFQLGRLTLDNEGGEPVKSYDIGIREDEPTFTEGIYLPNQNTGAEIPSWRWLGGKTKRVVIHFDSSGEPIGHIRLWGRPITNEIEAVVRFNGDRMGRIAFDDSIADYNIPLNSS